MVPSLSLYFIWKTDGNRNQHKWLGHKTYMYFYWWVFLGHSHEENGSASKSYSKNVFWPLLLGIGQSLLLVLIYLFHSWVIFFYITFIFLVHNVVPFMCIREAPDSFIYIRDSSLKKWFIIMVFMWLELELRLCIWSTPYLRPVKKILSSNVKKSFLSAGPALLQIYFLLQCIPWAREKRLIFKCTLSFPCWIAADFFST